MSTKYVVIIQCHIAHRKCSGFACTNAFYNKDEIFRNYDDDTRYISFTCGGCCGKGIAAKLEHLSKKLRIKNNIFLIGRYFKTKINGLKRMSQRTYRNYVRH